MKDTDKNILKSLNCGFNVLVHVFFFLSLTLEFISVWLSLSLSLFLSFLSSPNRRFQYLCDLLSEDSNWQLYREVTTRKLQTQSPLIPFLGIFLTTVALSQEADNLVVSSKESLSSQKRRDSLYENYVILEAVTVRKKLEKLRRRQSLESELFEREREREGYMNWVCVTVCLYVTVCVLCEHVSRMG